MSGVGRAFRPPVLRQITLLAALAAAGCSPASVASRDAAFRTRDREILQSLQEARADYDEGRVPRATYEVQLGALEAEEARLLEEVRAHTFKDMTEYNYWYRSRLKFPSPIAQARRALAAPSSP